jgi:hypothetical protein
MAPAQGTMNSTASGEWGNCRTAGEHMLVADLFLNNFIKVVHLFEISASLDENSGLLDTR